MPSIDAVMRNDTSVRPSIGVRATTTVVSTGDEGTGTMSDPRRGRGAAQRAVSVPLLDATSLYLPEINELVLR